MHVLWRSAFQAHRPHFAPPGTAYPVIVATLRSAFQAQLTTSTNEKETFICQLYLFFSPPLKAFYAVIISAFDYIGVNLQSDFKFAPLFSLDLSPTQKSPQVLR